MSATANEQAFECTQIKDAFGQAGSRFGDGQWVTAFQTVAFKAQHTHCVVHIQLDVLKFLTAFLRRISHALSKGYALVNQLTVLGELVCILGSIAANLLQRLLVFFGHASGKLVQFLIELGQGAAQGSSGFVTPGQRKITLQAARLAADVSDVPSIIEAGSGDTQRQQQDHGKAAQQLLAYGKVGE